MSSYLTWFEKTLELKCDFSIYTQDKYKNFTESSRYNSNNKTYIETDEISNCSFYRNLGIISKTISSQNYKSSMKDCRRIECYLPEYLVLIYSKFEWLLKSIKKFPQYDYYAWLDAGFSRFFNQWNIDSPWPENEKKYNIEKVSVIGNSYYQDFCASLKKKTHMWENRSMTSAGLFLGGKDIMLWFKKKIEETFNELLKYGCVNNEQILTDILSSENPEKFDVMFPKKHGDWLGLI